MSLVFRANRKASDADIIRLNSVGLSLATIARILNCHHTTITQRLKALNISPADTRRTFMEDVISSLSTSQTDWLADSLGPHLSIKQFITNLLTEEFIRSQTKANTPA